MSEQNTPFGDQPTSEVVNQPVVPSIPQEVSEFIGEGKKYKTVEDALKSVPNAQKHISTIEEENRAMKEELAKRKTAEELLAEMKSGLVPNETPLKPSIDANTIAEIVKNQLTQAEQSKKANENIATIVSLFTEKFGDKAKGEAEYIRIAQENGLTIDALNRLSASSPNAVITLAGLKNKSTPPASNSSGSVNTQALQGNNNESLSSKVKVGATTKEITNAWKIAGEKVKQTISKE